MNINVHSDTGSITKLAKHVPKIICFSKSFQLLSLPFFKKEEIQSFPLKECSLSTSAHLLDDSSKFPSKMNVLSFPEPLSFLSSATQRTIMPLSHEANLIITLLLLSWSRNSVACEITFAYASFCVLNSGSYVSLDDMLNILYSPSL